MNKEVLWVRMDVGKRGEQDEIVNEINIRIRKWEKEGDGKRKVKG